MIFVFGALDVIESKAASNPLSCRKAEKKAWLTTRIYNTEKQKNEQRKAVLIDPVEHPWIQPKTKDVHKTEEAMRRTGHFGRAKVSTIG